MKKLKFVIDLDGTLCEQVKSYESYDDALPFSSRIDAVNLLFKAGHHITIYTARGMKTFNENIHLVDENLYDMTAAWLNRHGVSYHRLIMGKVQGDVYVDDRGISPDTLELFARECLPSEE